MRPLAADIGRPRALARLLFVYQASLYDDAFRKASLGVGVDPPSKLLEYQLTEDGSGHHQPDELAPGDLAAAA